MLKRIHIRLQMLDETFVCCHMVVFRRSAKNIECLLLLPFATAKNGNVHSPRSMNRRREEDGKEREGFDREVEEKSFGK